ncbi:MAG TPA: hypothetical protein VJB08_00595 [Candidatus Nanoarchaeia archaeon]|nr:hypothetical protein [Candidatus Nanoarchaeia archaeon]
MRKIVLDSNEYVFHFTNRSQFLPELTRTPDIKIFINSLIFREVLQNISKSSINPFIKMLQDPVFVAIGVVPDTLINKYSLLGLKKGDTVIAALCEFVNAECLITENRHFLREVSIGAFTILSSKDFMKGVS